MALIGYARVSTAEQDTALQTDALRKAGCERVFEDTASGAKADRPGLADALAYLRDGDVLAVWRLDRLGRSMPGTVAKLAMRQPFVLFKGLTFQKLCLPGAFRPGDHHNKMLRPGLCVVHASPQYL
ncbi:invertase [Klebsiella quasipneumoniae]|nr:invertase [Klebsiella quasipneumoniae]SCA40099.1 invertase [Klebsiella quasipneumoniae]